jgi:hypothetical protein
MKEEERLRKISLGMSSPNHLLMREEGIRGLIPLGKSSSLKKKKKKIIGR